jgi:hypothetical protein
MNKILSNLRTSIFILTIIVLWNIFVPGLVAYLDGVFYSDDIEAKFPKHSIKAAESYNLYKQTRVSYNQLISNTDIKINDILQKQDGFTDLETLLKLRETYRNDLTRLKSPIIVSPFYNNRSAYYFLVCYIFLSISIFLLKPESSTKLNRKKILQSTLFVYIGWTFTTWLRNFVFYDDGRTIFSYVNYDISPSSFILQEFRTLVMAFLVAVLWQQWIKYYDKVCQETASWENDSASLLSMIKRADVVSNMFNKWQVNSVIIVAAFLPWTFFYWINVMYYGDSRYVVAALFMHVYWAISWILITLPLIHVYQKWTKLKSKTLATAAIKTDKKPEVDREINFLKELNPLTDFQISFAAVVSISSFLLPFVNTVIKPS